MLKKIIGLLFILMLITGCEHTPLEVASLEGHYDTSKIYHLNIPGLR